MGRSAPLPRGLILLLGRVLRKSPGRSPADRPIRPTNLLMATLIHKTRSDRAMAEANAERRAHRRMALRLPVECRREGQDGEYVVRTITQDICTSGIYLELDEPGFRKGDRLSVELTIPPSEGVSSDAGLGTCEAEVVRTNRVRRIGESFDRYGVALRFLGPLRISY